LIPWSTFLHPETPGSGTGFGTDTFCHNPYLDGHKIRGLHGICKSHMKKCWKWGLEIHHFHFISNISYNIISWINLIVGFNLSNAIIFPHNFVGWVLFVVQKTNSSNFCNFFPPRTSINVNILLIYLQCCLLKC
jgi:hypothetical protein